MPCAEKNLMGIDESGGSPHSSIDWRNDRQRKNILRSRALHALETAHKILQKPFSSTKSQNSKHLHTMQRKKQPTSSTKTKDSFRFQPGWPSNCTGVLGCHFSMLSGRLASSARFVNPLWGHCRGFKIEKNAILQESLLSEKRSTFADYNLTLSESFCLTDHENQIKKFLAHWKVCQKSSQREVIRKNAYIAPKTQSLLFPALHLKFSRSLTNFQTSPARHSSLRSKITAI